MFGGKGRKKRKRWMALLLAGAMVLSGMGTSPISVQAEETAVEQVQETEPMEAVLAEQGEVTVSGGDVVVLEKVEKEAVKTSEEGEAAALTAEAEVPAVQNTSGNSDGYVLDAAELATFGQIQRKMVLRKQQERTSISQSIIVLEQK